ncbi:hypothetical protein OS493_022127 [Desmophyllum pertusum]|uniref:Uncharacterized protein n=1 Tax=Desmophyllum pertusum TaxID=174260 RepID=A0A9W9YQF3_9CNID|nr:hypothetical protein OS493_022127 [Desmophyllum pertusum]
MRTRGLAVVCTLVTILQAVGACNTELVLQSAQDNLDETLFANQNQIVNYLPPITNQAPFRYSFGDCFAPVLEFQEMALETSCEKSPCGTNPTTKFTYIGQGS